MKRFFRSIIDDLHALQVDGLVINATHVKFFFSTLTAHNLAAHEFGGYHVSFSSGYFCRRCHIFFNDVICLFHR